MSIWQESVTAQLAMIHVQIKELQSKVSEQDEKIDDCVEKKEMKTDLIASPAHSHLFNFYNFDLDFGKEPRGGHLILVVGEGQLVDREGLTKRITRNLDLGNVVEIPVHSKPNWEHILELQNQGKHVIVQLETCNEMRPDVRQRVDLLCWDYRDLENKEYRAAWAHWLKLKTPKPDWNSYLFINSRRLQHVERWFNVQLIFPHGPIADKLAPHSFLCWNPKLERIVTV